MAWLSFKDAANILGTMAADPRAEIRKIENSSEITDIISSSKADHKT